MSLQSVLEVSLGKTAMNSVSACTRLGVTMRQDTATVDLDGGEDGVIKVCHSFVGDNVDLVGGEDRVIKVHYSFVGDNVDLGGGAEGVIKVHHSFVGDCGPGWRGRRCNKGTSLLCGR